jgi:hypothetical protein
MKLPIWIKHKNEPSKIHTAVKMPLELLQPV